MNKVAKGGVYRALDKWIKIAPSLVYSFLCILLYKLAIYRALDKQIKTLAKEKVYKAIARRVNKIVEEQVYQAIDRRPGSTKP